MSVAWYLCPCSWERGRWWRFYFSPIPTRRTRIPPVKLNAKYFLFSFPPANQCDLRLSLTHRRRCCPWQRGKRCRRSSWRTPTRREWDLLKRLDHFDWSRATPWRSTVQWQHLFYFSPCTSGYSFAHDFVNGERTLSTSGKRLFLKARNLRAAHQPSGCEESGIRFVTSNASFV